MDPKDILARTREMINEHADDPDKWWYANRYVFARLMLDERKTKVGVKQQLLDAQAQCHACGEKFDSKKDVHLHRMDGSKGYGQGNCVLMHAECHRKFHASHQEEAAAANHGEPTLTKYSKCYADKSFLYWWDISPQLAKSLGDFDSIEFVKKDAAQRCTVSVEALKGFLTPQRQTTRGQGNWGIKVLKEHPDELAFEPAVGGGKWLFLPVVWIGEQED